MAIVGTNKIGMVINNSNNNYNEMKYSSKPTFTINITAHDKLRFKT